MVSHNMEEEEGQNKTEEEGGRDALNRLRRQQRLAPPLHGNLGSLPLTEFKTEHETKQCLCENSNSGYL